MHNGNDQVYVERIASVWNKRWKMKIQGLSRNWAELPAEQVYLENGYRWQEEKISRDEIK